MKLPLQALLTAPLLLLSPIQSHAGSGKPTLLAWNNLGMHCMDDDYTVFSILPPFNTLNAHYLDAAGKLVINPAIAGVNLTFESIADPDGSINCTSAGKTNFWSHSAALYGASLPVDVGLTGVKMPGPTNTPQAMTFSSGMKWFEATGIPISPTDDAGRHQPYPMMRIAARNASGTLLAKADIVVPVSDEMDCRACHASNAGPAARPVGGWVNDPNGKRDFRLNILRLHDEHQATKMSYAPALLAAGYSENGLYETVVSLQTSVLCAKCHLSEALPGSGQAGISPLTRAMHAKHATVVSPADGLTLDNISSRTSCYQCHPGSATRCLRGAMGSSVAADGAMSMQCQSCHGNMSTVGSSNRTGWLQEPTCQSCHTGDAVSNGGAIRFTSSFDAPGHQREPANRRFATSLDAPAAGLSLYRFSSGHGGLQCSACHGSTHAEFPASHRNDNLQSLNLQGHTGVVSDCTACHTSNPSTVTGGPHGMHPISQNWATNHADSARAVGLTECQKCHGADYRGTVLSRALGDRTFSTKYGAKTFKRGMEVTCYVCHNGANSSNATSKTAPTVAAAKLAVPAGGTGSLTLAASGTGPVARIVQQPMHGTVGLTGRVATYFPDGGYNGPDFFTYLATDSGSYIDSAPATISVNVGASQSPADADGDGLNDFLEYALGLDPGFPSNGSTWGRSEELIGGLHYQTLTLPRGPILPPDASVNIFVSGDLHTWNAGIGMTGSAYQFKVRDNVPIESANRRFIRAEAIRP